MAGLPERLKKKIEVAGPVFPRATTQPAPRQDVRPVVASEHAIRPAATSDHQHCLQRPYRKIMVEPDQLMFKKEQRTKQHLTSWP